MKVRELTARFKWLAIISHDAESHDSPFVHLLYLMEECGFQRHQLGTDDLSLDERAARCGTDRRALLARARGRGQGLGEAGGLRARLFEAVYRGEDARAERITDVLEAELAGDEKSKNGASDPTSQLLRQMLEMHVAVAEACITLLAERDL
jgi:hypothetical protein